VAFLAFNSSTFLACSFSGGYCATTVASRPATSVSLTAKPEKASTTAF